MNGGVVYYKVVYDFLIVWTGLKMFLVLLFSIVLGGFGKKKLYWIENNLLFVDKNKGFPIFGTCTWNLNYDFYNMSIWSPRVRRNRTLCRDKPKTFFTAKLVFASTLPFMQNLWLKLNRWLVRRHENVSEWSEVFYLTLHKDFLIIIQFVLFVV